MPQPPAPSVTGPRGSTSAPNQAATTNPKSDGLLRPGSAPVSAKSSIQSGERVLDPRTVPATPSELPSRKRKSSILASMNPPAHAHPLRTSLPTADHNHAEIMAKIRMQENPKTYENLEGTGSIGRSLASAVIDPVSQYQAAQLNLLARRRHLIDQVPQEGSELPDDIYLAQEQERMETLEKTRGRLFSWTLYGLFQISVIATFILCLLQSFKYIVQESKFQAYKLAEIFNCSDVVPKMNWMHHLVNIFLGVMCACVVHAETKSEACLCLAYILAQGIHTSFELFQYFMLSRFLTPDTMFESRIDSICTLIIGLTSSVLALHRYHDLTDRVSAKPPKLKSSGRHVLNNVIIYQNMTSFMQRKYVWREVIDLQKYKIVRKLEAYAAKGKQPDYKELYEELMAIKMAMKDVDSAATSDLGQELINAVTKRLEEIRKDPTILQLDKLKREGSEILLVSSNKAYIK